MGKAKPRSKPKPKPGPDELAPLRRLSVEALAEAIPRFAGNLAAVGRSFGVTRTAVWEYVQGHPELRPVVRDARETRVDDAESSLDRAVKAGEGWAVTLILKTLGRGRGYVERHEHEHSGSVGVTGEVVVRTREEAVRFLALESPDAGNGSPPPGRAVPAAG